MFSKVRHLLATAKAEVFGVTALVLGIVDGTVPEAAPTMAIAKHGPLLTTPSKEYRLATSGSMAGCFTAIRQICSYQFARKIGLLAGNAHRLVAGTLEPFGKREADALDNEKGSPSHVSSNRALVGLISGPGRASRLGLERIELGL
jgi:hypothetical protein